MFPASKSKYHAKKVRFQDLTFDSQLEYKRYLFLKDAERRGEITDLKLQVKFSLIPAHYQTIQRFGKRGQMLKPKQVCIEKETAYYADFVYQCLTPDMKLHTVVEDTKSKATRTEVYKLKRKLMLDKYGIQIREVSRATEPICNISTNK